MVRSIVPLNNEVSYEVQWIIINWLTNFLIGGGAVNPLDYTNVTPDDYKIEYNYSFSRARTHTHTHTHIHTHNVALRRTLMLKSACHVQLVGQISAFQGLYVFILMKKPQTIS